MRRYPPGRCIGGDTAGISAAPLQCMFRRCFAGGCAGRDRAQRAFGLRAGRGPLPRRQRPLLSIPCRSVCGGGLYVPSAGRCPVSGIRASAVPAVPRVCGTMPLLPFPGLFPVSCSVRYKGGEFLPYPEKFHLDASFGVSCYCRQFVYGDFLQVKEFHHYLYICFS